jgi:hypothetical protein
MIMRMGRDGKASAAPAFRDRTQDARLTASEQAAKNAVGANFTIREFR